MVSLQAKDLSSAFSGWSDDSCSPTSRMLVGVPRLSLSLLGSCLMTQIHAMTADTASRRRAMSTGWLSGCRVGTSREVGPDAQDQFDHREAEEHDPVAMRGIEQ